MTDTPNTPNRINELLNGPQPGQAEVGQPFPPELGQPTENQAQPEGSTQPAGFNEVAAILNSGMSVPEVVTGSEGSHNPTLSRVETQAVNFDAFATGKMGDTTLALQGTKEALEPGARVMSDLHAKVTEVKEATATNLNVNNGHLDDETIGLLDTFQNEYRTAFATTAASQKTGNEELRGAGTSAHDVVDEADAVCSRIDGEIEHLDVEASKDIRPAAHAVQDSVAKTGAAAESLRGNVRDIMKVLDSSNVGDLLPSVDIVAEKFTAVVAAARRMNHEAYGEEEVREFSGHIGTLYKLLQEIKEKTEVYDVNHKSVVALVEKADAMAGSVVATKES